MTARRDVIVAARPRTNTVRLTVGRAGLVVALTPDEAIDLANRLTDAVDQLDSPKRGDLMSTVRSDRAFADWQRRRGAQKCERCGHRNDWHGVDVTAPVLASDLATRELVEVEPIRGDTVRCRAEKAGEPPCPCIVPNPANADVMA